MMRQRITCNLFIYHTKSEFQVITTHALRSGAAASTAAPPYNWPGMQPRVEAGHPPPAALLYGGNNATEPISSVWSAEGRLRRRRHVGDAGRGDTAVMRREAGHHGSAGTRWGGGLLGAGAWQLGGGGGGVPGCVHVILWQPRVRTMENQTLIRAPRPRFPYRSCYIRSFYRSWCIRFFFARDGSERRTTYHGRTVTTDCKLIV